MLHHMWFHEFSCWKYTWGNFPLTQLSNAFMDNKDSTSYNNQLTWMHWESMRRVARKYSSVWHTLYVEQVVKDDASGTTQHHTTAILCKIKDNAYRMFACFIYKCILYWNNKQSNEKWSSILSVWISIYVDLNTCPIESACEACLMKSSSDAREKIRVKANARRKPPMAKRASTIG